MNNTQMTARIAILLFIIPLMMLVSGCATCRTKSNKGEKVAVKVELKGWHDIFISIDNVANVPIQMNAHTLPWKWRYGMCLKAFKDNASGSPLKERFTIADPPITKESIIVLPGKSINGTIDLRERFPNLKQVLMRRNVIIFWSYVPEYANDSSRIRISGSLTIPKF